jgi:phosphoserine phosphatase RsbU/P
MRVLIAEDDLVSRKVLESTLTKWGHEVLVAENGSEALDILLQDDAPNLALLDWMMPLVEGLEVVRQVRAAGHRPLPYMIMVTARTDKGSLVQGLEAGADDYVTKPFDRDELRARLQVGCRMIELHTKLVQHARQLEDTLAQVKLLQGLLPMCCYCKRIRDDGNYWHQLECYIMGHSEARFSHGICPHCMTNIVKPELEQMAIACSTEPDTADHSHV